jgi:hypothetical protein
MALTDNYKAHTLGSKPPNKLWGMGPLKSSSSIVLTRLSGPHSRTENDLKGKREEYGKQKWKVMKKEGGGGDELQKKTNLLKLFFTL